MDIKPKHYLQLFIILVTLGLYAGFMPSTVYAGAIVKGHAFTMYQGAKVYLKGAQIKWTLTSEARGTNSCGYIPGVYRIVKSGEPISHTECPEGIQCLTTHVPLDCRQGEDIACMVNSRGETMDEYGNINYFFPRTQCFGCVDQDSTVAPSFPEGYTGLPGGLDPRGGQWRSSPVLIHTVGDVDFLEIDFEWVPGPGGPTITPACGQPCTSGGTTPICPEICPICAVGPTPGVSTCQPPSLTPILTPTPTLGCNSPCTPGGTPQCPIQCPICAVGSAPGVGTCQLPSLTPTKTPTPSPTRTPTPTSSPIPPSPSLTPVPTQAANCDCDPVDVSGSFAAGQTVTVTGNAHVYDPDGNNPNDAYVKTMEYHFQKKNPDTNLFEDVVISGSAQVQSVPVPTPYPTCPSTAPTTRRYQTMWTYKVPENLSSGTYRIKVNIICDHCSTIAATLTPTGTHQSTSEGKGAVAPAQNRGFFGQMIQFFRLLFGIQTNRFTTTSVPTVTPTPTGAGLPSGSIELVPTGRSLQLGVWQPPTVTPTPGKCTSIELTIP